MFRHELGLRRERLGMVDYCLLLSHCTELLMQVVVVAKGDESSLRGESSISLSIDNV